MGNPHCVVFVPRVDTIDIEKVGPSFEKADIFAHRVNTEFVRVVNETTIKMRVWERGNGETPACGTGACAAVVAAVENGYCKKGDDVTVKLRGGDLVVKYTDEKLILMGNAELIEKDGFLLGVGANYILINEIGTNDITACDFYNIKFIYYISICCH